MSLKPALYLLLAATALPVPARAVDLSAAPAVKPIAVFAPPQPSWAGAYLSGFGLYGANIADTTPNMHGPGVGGTVGYNVQLGSGVVGLRADLAWLNMSNTATLAALGSSTINYLGDVDLLLGLPLGDGRTLAYGVGGFAYGGVTPVVGANITPIGWNVGAGLAHQLLGNWQTYIEGDFFALGSNAPGASTPPYNVFQAKAGLTYRF